MTYKDLFEIKEGLEESKKFQGIKFAIKIVKNLKLINSELDVIKEAFIPSKEYLDLVKKTNNLKEKYQKEKDSKVKENLSRQFEELTSNSKDIIEEHSKKEAEFLSQEVKIKFTPIKENELPEDISADILVKLDSIIKYG